MAEAVENGLILSFDEIRILLYSLGIREVEGIYMPEKKFAEDDIVRALQHMSRRGLITAVDAEFIIREDLIKMLTVMGRPDGTMIWGREETGGPEYFCYIAPDRIVVSERYWKKKDALKLRMFTAEAFEAWREQYAEGADGL